VNSFASSWATPETAVAFDELVAALGDRVVAVDTPESARLSLDWHRLIMECEMAANLSREWDEGREQLSASLRAQLARGREASAYDYQRACARIGLLNEGFEEIFERCDAIVTPAAPGSAPKGLEATGDPAFCTLWTLCGMPAITLPLMRGADGLPMGVQLVGPRDGDLRLLRMARWLMAHLAGGADERGGQS
jgi:Asp-tRNA(Asn)/Glu-tRNA(Gln) amidotransferase A subunit family amidase